MGRINKTFKKSKTLVEQLTKYGKILHKTKEKNMKNVIKPAKILKYRIN